MKKRYFPLFFLFVSSMLPACQSTKNVLQVSQLPGFDEKSADHILFLNFKITGQEPGREQVILLSATPANGKFKHMGREVHYPYQIKAVPRYNTSHLETPVFYENPLRRSAEIPSPTGALSKTELKEKEGTLQMRIQYEESLQAIDLYSLTPDQPERKIYTLKFKP